MKIILKQIIHWYTSVEAFSYQTTMIFGAGLGFGLSTILLAYVTNLFELMKLLLILTSFNMVGRLFRIITLFGTKTY